MDQATLRALMAYGIYLLLFFRGLRTEDHAAALTKAPERAQDAVSHADVLLNALNKRSAE
jgi:hypothetical protein